MLRSKRLWIAIIIILVIGGLVYYSTADTTTAQSDDEPTLQTATVLRGDIVIFASGSGNLMPASELNLGFRTGGTLVELLLEVGDKVSSGDVLARLDDTNARNQLAQAQINLETAQLRLSDVETNAENLDDPDRLTSTRIGLDQAITGVEDAQEQYDEAFDPARDWELNDPKRSDRLLAERDGAERAVQRAQDSLEIASSQYNLTLSSLENDARNIESELRSAQLSVEQSELSLESAQQALDNIVLTTPINGTVLTLMAQQGEAVGTGPIITLIDLNSPLVRFWVEEADLAQVAPGFRIEVVFEALPDEIFDGEIVRVDPALVTVDQTPAIQVWATVDISSSSATLLSGMNADLDVIAAETQNALLVPLQALRELAPDSYAVFIVTSNGELELRPVEVGLQDFANAEILSGLQVGDVVSTGTVDTE